MTQHSITYFVLTHTLDPWGGVKRPKHFFTESSHVAYQIKGYGTLSTMHAHILSLHTPSTPRWSQNVITFFLIVVMLHIKLKGLEHKTPCKHIVYHYTHPRSLGGVKS